MPQKYKRRQYIINRKLQLMIIAYTLLTSWCAIVTYYAINQTFTLDWGSEGFTNFIKFLYTISIGLCIGSLILALLFGFLFSNHIAGPVYRIKTHLDDIAKGKAPSKVTIREADFHSDLAESVNRLIDLYEKAGASGSVHPDFQAKT